VTSRKLLRDCQRRGRADVRARQKIGARAISGGDGDVDEALARFDAEISARLVHNLRTKVPKGGVVLAPVIVSYRVAASAPVYVVTAPVVHVANPKANDPCGRARPVRHWVLTNDPRVACRDGATWQIRNGRLSSIR
jgi:hypothetical protein